ncbi:MAG: single-stranded-DNA-specific exonuclease RecJ [Oscillospiraceae bacterium]|nr:single-stranded-DNA-specific exonuclease RecJ [Oscillospiraceae bacterium]
MRFFDWEIAGFDRDSAVEFCRNGVNPLVAVFLTARGFTAIEDIKSYMSDTASAIYDPMLLADMDKAVERITFAMENRQRIAIYGDYDVDGVTASALLADYFRAKGADFEVYIPHRINEGYGLNRQAIDDLKSRGVALIVTVDCGVTALEEAEYVRELGLGLVITDHHQCRDTLPVADAVVDPQRPDCRYPNDALAGVGVAFKLVCALEGEGSEDAMFRQYGDLVALGTVADVMPVTGENRVLIRRGLRVLENSQRTGLRQLTRDACTSSGKIGTACVGFVLAPRLNAAGRMGKTNVSLELLLTKDANEADLLVDELTTLNAERRELENEIYENALSLIGSEAPEGPIVLASRSWYQGVTGIVAAKMSDRYFLPAIMISVDEDGIGRGSCRSFGPFGIISALTACQDLLISYGGHEMAAGVTIAESDIDEFRRRINEYYRDNIKSMPKPQLKLDFEVEKPEILTVTNVEALGGLEPFGNGNPPPCLCIKGAVVSEIIPVGAGKHTRLKIEKSGKALDCIYFSMPPDELDVKKGELCDIAFEPQINEFRGRITVQLQVFDIKRSV